MPPKQDDSTPLTNRSKYSDNPVLPVPPRNVNIASFKDTFGGPASYQTNPPTPAPSKDDASSSYHAPQAGSSAPPAGYGSTFADQQHRQPENPTFAGSGLPPTGPPQAPTVPEISSVPNVVKGHVMDQIAELRKNESVADRWKAGISAEETAALFGVEVGAVKAYFGELGSNDPDGQKMRRRAQDRILRKKARDSRRP